MNTDHLLAKVVKLEYDTLGWNVVSCVPLIIFSRQQHSLALFGFGVDSVIEILASVIVIWQLKAAYNKRHEQLAVKCIGVSFILLSVYIIIQAWLNLTGSFSPKPTIVSIIWLLVTALVMFSLANGKKWKKQDRKKDQQPGFTGGIESYGYRRTVGNFSFDRFGFC
jgi:multisubunit Na+/H+ antiporter MnhG subunit